MTPVAVEESKGDVLSLPTVDGSDGCGANGRCAASPDMADRKERRQSLGEDNEIDADSERQHGQDSRAVHELSGMRDFLAKRTIRWVFVDWILVAWRHGRAMERHAGFIGDHHGGEGHETDRLRFPGGLGNVDMGLDNETLHSERKQPEHHHDEPHGRGTAGDSPAGRRAHSASSDVAILVHRRAKHHPQEY